MIAAWPSSTAGNPMPAAPLNDPFPGLYLHGLVLPYAYYAQAQLREAFITAVVSLRPEGRAAFTIDAHYLEVGRTEEAGAGIVCAGITPTDVAPGEW